LGRRRLDGHPERREGLSSILKNNIVQAVASAAGLMTDFLMNYGLISMRLTLITFGALAVTNHIGFSAGAIPKGWFAAGDHPNNYEMSIDAAVKHSLIANIALLGMLLVKGLAQCLCGEFYFQ